MRANKFKNEHRRKSAKKMNWITNEATTAKRGVCNGAKLLVACQIIVWSLGGIYYTYIRIRIDKFARNWIEIFGCFSTSSNFASSLWEMKFKGQWQMNHSHQWIEHISCIYHNFTEYIDNIVIVMSIYHISKFMELEWQRKILPKSLRHNATDFIRPQKYLYLKMKWHNDNNTTGPIA